MLGPIRHCELPHAACSNFTLPFTRCRYCRHHYQDEPKPAIAIATPGEWQCKVDVHNRCPHRCLQRQQRQRVTEGTARPHRMGPIKYGATRPKSGRSSSRLSCRSKYLSPCLQHISACHYRGKFHGSSFLVASSLQMSRVCC